MNFWKKPHPLTQDFSRPARSKSGRVMQLLWRDAWGLYRIRRGRGQAHQQITAEMARSVQNSIRSGGKNFTLRLMQALTLAAMPEWRRIQIISRAPYWHERPAHPSREWREPLWWLEVQRRDMRAYDPLFARLVAPRARRLDAGPSGVLAACEPVRTDAPGPKSQDAAERSTPHAEKRRP